MISSHLAYVNNILHTYNKTYQKLLFVGDFAVAMENKFMIDFCELNDLSSLIDKPTCNKNFDKPTCIDLTLADKPSYFQHSNVFETGISDFHFLTVTELKMWFQKLKPQVITYRNHKNFDHDKFKADIKTCRFDKSDTNSFKETILSAFNKYAPIKKKYIPANKESFMAKNLHKEIMKRPRLRKKHLKSKSLIDRKNNNIQCNFCKKL